MTRGPERRGPGRRGRETQGFPWLRSVLAAASGIAAAAFAALAVPLGFAVAFGLLVALAVVAWNALPVESTGPQETERRPGRPGTRPDVASLAWALTARHRDAGRAGLDRVREAARHRLARHGIDLDDPRDRTELEGLFGPAGMLLLTTRGGRAVSLDTVERCLDVLDELDVRHLPHRDPSEIRQERDTA